MALVLVIPRKGGVDARFGRQVRCRGCDGLDSRLFIVGDDRHRLSTLPRLGRGSCTPCPEPRWPNTDVLPPLRARAHGGPTTASSTIHADSRDPWPCRTP